ncbi:MAG: hypothetical protein ACE5JX_20115 [Acidobacteriota bacterium]
MKRSCGLFLVPLALIFSGANWLAAQNSPEARTPTAAENRPALNFAASQHEIILLLLEEGEFDTIPGEFSRILALGLSGEQEKLVTQSAWQIVERLRDLRQFSLGHEIVDEALATIRQPENKFSLLMLKAKIYQDQKLFGLAIQTLRKAQTLNPR